MSDEPIILIEFADENGFSLASTEEDLERLKQKSAEALEIAMETIRSMARYISQSLDQLEHAVTPNEVEIEFGVKLDLETGIVLPWITKVTTGGQLGVKFKWNIQKARSIEPLANASQNLPTG